MAAPTFAFGPIAQVWLPANTAVMHSSTAFDRRETLNATELGRLKAQLVIEVERYRDAIRGYSAEKMARHGTPFLAELEAKVAEVERLVARPN